MPGHNGHLRSGAATHHLIHAKVSLLLLGFDPFPPQAGQSAVDKLDAATAKALGAFQAQRGLPVTRILDDATAANLDAAVEEANANAAYGFVSTPGGAPATGVLVELFDWDLRRPTLLGKAETRADGFYLVRYTDQQVTAGEIASADLYLRAAFNDENDRPVVTESAKHFNAGRIHRIDLTLPHAVPAKESEVERYIATLLPLLDHAAIGLAELTDDEVPDVAAETGIATEHVAFLRRATVLGKEHNLAPEVFYGLFRQGLPTNLPRLLAEKPTRWREALKASLAGRIISSNQEATLDSVIERLSELAIEQSFKVPDDANSSVPVGAVLATSTLTPAAQRKIARFVLLHEGDSDPWQALAESGDVDAPTLAAARFAVDTDVVLGGHLGTLKALQANANRLSLNTARDLARLTPADWKNVASRAGSLPGGENSVDTYAAALADRVERAFPTAVIAQRIGSDRVLGHPEAVKFLEAHPDFDLLSTIVDDYLDGGQALAEVADKDGLRVRLKTWQRTALIAPDAQRAKHTEALMRHGFTSAYAVQRAGIDHSAAPSATAGSA
ncbi:MAG: peptidoglycan-binding protein [Nitrospira sp.]|nr:peptidoglycan-binding protein [Nitrospira sp.]